MTPRTRFLSAGVLTAVISLSASCSDSEPSGLELNGPPAALTLVSGNSQTGPAGGVLTKELVVLLQDAAGKPVPAVAVSWTTTGGSLSPAVDSTGDDGQASVQWTLPSTPGDYSAEAAVPGLSPVRFTAKATPPGGALVFRYLDAGSYHACGITTTEELYCWGYNGDGQAGDSAGASNVYPTLLTRQERFRAVSGGRYHTCGISLSGEVTCWGASRDGRTSGGGVATYQYVQAGEMHTCGITLSKEVWCWGYNGEGEVGRPPIRPGSVLSADTIYVPRSIPFRSVTTGGLHSCAITTSGVAYCWGFNREGQLGIGVQSGLDSLYVLPKLVGPAFRADPFTVVPRPPDPDFPIAPGPFIAAGFAHTCGLTTSGGLLCWGLNEDGQLGNGSTASSFVPVAISTPVTFVQITAGNSHTCAITGQGAAYCWGDNTFGQLGDGTKSDRLSPVPVAGGLAFAYIKAGELSTCGLSTTGVGYCWGDNEYGQLGDGTRIAASTPRKVAFQP